MNNYLLDDLIDHLFYKSGNRVVDDFIRNTQINSNLGTGMMEFVSYDQFKDIEFIFEVKACKATWIDCNIQSWNKKEMNFKRSGSMQVVLKRLNNPENLSKEPNEVQINLILI